MVMMYYRPGYTRPKGELGTGLSLHQTDLGGIPTTPLPNITAVVTLFILC